MLALTAPSTQRDVIELALSERLSSKFLFESFLKILNYMFFPRLLDITRMKPIGSKHHYLESGMTKQH